VRGSRTLNNVFPRDELDATATTAAAPPTRCSHHGAGTYEAPTPPERSDLQPAAATTAAEAPTCRIGDMQLPTRLPHCRPTAPPIRRATDTPPLRLVAGTRAATQRTRRRHYGRGSAYWPYRQPAAANISATLPTRRTTDPAPPPWQPHHRSAAGFTAAEPLTLRASKAAERETRRTVDTKTPTRQQLCRLAALRKGLRDLSDRITHPPPLLLLYQH